MFLNTRNTSTLINFLKTLRFRKKIVSSCVFRVQEFSSTHTSHEQESSYAVSYTMDEQVLILEKINTCTVDQLKGYRITEARIKKLIAYRDRHGSFKSINNVLLTQGIDINILDKFCKSIIKGKTKQKSKLTNIKGDWLTPALQEDEAITTFAGIWVCGKVISWAQLDTDWNLLNWECESLEVEMTDGLVTIVQEVANVVSKVPASHAYIMESDPIIPFSRMNNVAYYRQLQRQQIVSTIVSLLGTRERYLENISKSNILINRIYMMRSRAPARLFNLLIGSEIVSAKEVVEKMINNKNHNDDNTINYIHADFSLMESYNSRDVYQRERMNWALLLTSAFGSLSIQRNQALIKGLKKTSRKE